MSDKFNDDGQGIDQPVLIKGDNLAIFDVGDHYELKKMGVGMLKAFPKDIKKEFWQELEKDGWIKPQY